jgi:hypothetical protein
MLKLAARNIKILYEATTDQALKPYAYLDGKAVTNIYGKYGWFAWSLLY